MNAFEKILKILDARMTTPVPYGIFHLVSVVLIIGLTIFMCKKFHNPSDYTLRKILLIFSLIMIVLEIYKQLNFSYNHSNDVWDYEWYAFPFQFCSTPMYITFLASIIKNEKIHDSLICFLATFSLFAGTAVMILPTTIYISTIGINIQTTVHHGFQIVLGVYLLSSGRIKLNFKDAPKTMIKSAIVFSCLIVVAMIMNIAYVNLGGTETFNMFFISPYFECSLPLLSIIYPLVPYIVFLLIYILGFTICGFIMLSIAIGIKNLVNIIKNKNNLTTCKTEQK